MKKEFWISYNGNWIKNPSKWILFKRRIKYLLKNCSNIKILRPKFIEIKKIHDDILNRKTVFIRDYNF